MMLRYETLDQRKQPMDSGIAETLYRYAMTMTTTADR
jgi:hypothetical protein